jgi:hypothetical protein
MLYFVIRKATQRVGGERSCTSSLRVIPPPPKPGTMLPYHTIVRGRCHDSVPCLLPTRAPGTLGALCHATLHLAQPMRCCTAKASRTGQTPTSTLPRAQTVWGSHTQAPLCPVRARSRASQATAPGATRSDASDRSTPMCNRHLEALLPSCGL